MTLIITGVTALAVTVIYMLMRRHSVGLCVSSHLGMLMLMYWGATLMWCVDGIASLAEGEPFVTLSDPAVVTDDSALGLLVVFAGFCAWSGYLMVETLRTRQRVAAASRNV
ncbi:hypothetical protein ACJ41I_00800 [Bifidobacterium catenulatum]|uniref:hypothetical protein n=1 Tax=Bifidobacterium catenulatum TaxID=1686 RepID=UPI003D33227F